MEKNTKEWVQYLSAVALIVSAIALAFLSFFVTLDIGPGPLTYIGEALSAALIIFGFGVYVSNKFNEFKTEIRKEVLSMKSEKQDDPVIN